MSDYFINIYYVNGDKGVVDYFDKAQWDRNAVAYAEWLSKGDNVKRIDGYVKRKKKFSAHKGVVVFLS